MKFPFSFLSVAVCACALVASVSRAATIDQYGNRKLSEADLGQINYDSAKRLWGERKAPQIDTSTFKAYEDARWANDPETQRAARLTREANERSALSNANRAAANARSTNAKSAEIETAVAAALQGKYYMIKTDYKPEFEAALAAAKAAPPVQSPIDAGDQEVCVAKAVEYLAQIPANGATPEQVLAGAANAAVALGHIRNLNTLPWLDIRVRALESLTGRRSPFDCNPRAIRKTYPPEAEFQLALGFLLTAPASSEEDPQQFRQLRNLIAAGALHTLATAKDLTGDKDFSLQPALAAVVRRAQRADPPLELSPEAGQLVERVLRANYTTRIETYWGRLAGPAPATPATPPVFRPAVIDIRALIPMAWVSDRSLLRFVIESLLPDAGPRAAWLDDPATVKIFRNFAEQQISLQAAAIKAKPADYWPGAERELPERLRRTLALGLRAPSPDTAQQLVAWKSNAEKFRKEPHRFAPQIILDHAAGSPEAVWAIDIANKFINDTWGDPSEEQWPVLDRLARNHFQLLSPGVKICAALAIVHLHAGRPLSAADKALVERLVLNSNPTNKGHLLGVIKVIWLGLGSPEVAEDFAFKAVREEPEGTFAKKLLEVGVALRISRLQAAARPDSAQFDQALPELIDDMTKVAKGNGSTFDPWGELAPTLAWLIDRRRQLDGRYPANEYSAAIAKFQLPARGAPSYERSLRELLNMARAERLTSVFNRTGVEALGQAAVGGNGDKEVARLLWDSASTEYPRWWRPNNKDQYGYEKWPGSYNDSRLNLRFALHERADALAACFLWLRHAPENDLVKLSHRVVELAIENSGKQRLPGTQLLGRDLALGGLGTRALLALHELQPTEIDLQHTTLNEKAESWALGVAALPAALPPKAVLDQLAAIAIDEKKSAAVRRAVTLGLGAATEAVFHDAADSIGSIAWRRHALGLLARHAEKIPVDTTGWPENLVPHAGKFLTARVAWELSRLDAPALPPAERAAPLVKELGPLAASLAFLARTEFTTSAKLPATVERQLLLEPDPDFAPALLRAASTLPDQEPLIARYLGAGAPKNSTEWSKLAEGRSWW